jgi:putative restriction endonuclease
LKFWLGVTDNTWFNYLSDKGFDEVNFWQPSATPPFKNAPIGMPFLFKLKRPKNHIAGGGFFVTYSRLPVSVAWEVFGEKNGAASFDDLRKMLGPLLSGSGLSGDIGCTVLSRPFFLLPDSWVIDPPGWASNIVRGKMFESQSSDGAIIWNGIEHALSPRPSVYGLPEHNPGYPVRDENRQKYGETVLVAPRLGQSSFRVMVTDAYKRKCAITGENTLVALEAAHIVPYAEEGTHDIRNGLLLRADFHRLFDVGLVSVTPDLRVKISPRIRDAYFNGKAYYRTDNQPLSVIPDHPAFQPDPDRLNWHLKNRFQV